MANEIADLAARIRAELLEEAGEARRLASCLSTVDVEEARAPGLVREAEAALEEFCAQALALAEEIGNAMGAGAAFPELSRRWEEVALARRSAFAAIGGALAASVISLEESQHERGIDRMRLLEGLRVAWREDARVDELNQSIQAFQASLAGQQAEIARLNAILSQDGHQLIIGLGSVLSRHPAILRALRVPIRVVRWLTQRDSR